MSSNDPVDSAAVDSAAPLGEAPENYGVSAAQELQQAEQSDAPADDAASGDAGA